MLLNLTKHECESHLSKNITINNCLVERSTSTKLLGLTIDEKQNWKEQIEGSNGLVNALNYRTFTLRRIKNQIPRNELIKVVQSLWMSKMRYGLQFNSRVRTNPSDPVNQNMKAVQVSQNKMLRMIDGVSLKDHVTSQSLLKKYNLSSANQLAGEIKLLEAWKSIHIPEYPFQMMRNDTHMANSDRTLRPNSIKIWKDNA